MPPLESPRASSQPAESQPADSQQAGSQPTSRQSELVDALAQSTFVVAAVLTRIGAEYDLSLTQLRAFGILRDRRPRMADLADRLGLEKSTMSGLVSRAEKRGLMRREASVGDGRAVAVVLTDEGAALAETAYQRVTEALAPLLDTLGADDQRTLRMLLEQMLDSPTS